jgi:hypothetical protein
MGQGKGSRPFSKSNLSASYKMTRKKCLACIWCIVYLWLNLPSSEFLFSYFSLVVLEIKPRSSQVLGKCSTTEIPQSYTCCLKQAQSIKKLYIFLFFLLNYLWQVMEVQSHHTWGMSVEGWLKRKIITNLILPILVGFICDSRIRL